MSYIALYRKWRPKTFDDVVEQTHVIQALKNTVTSRRISHAYLFCGTRGTGKTTIAKIFARAINCLNPINGNPCNECDVCRGVLDESLLDIIEIDAASNNGVDNIREIRDEVAYAPARAQFKVYIIDEVHMLSSGAFNALLKTLEEPPSHVVFLLATTDPHKLPATILSRCQRFDFKRISQRAIIDRLKYICTQSECTLDDDAATTIARLADGALRDAISILDQCLSMSNNNVTLEVVRNVTGITNVSFVINVLQSIIDFDSNTTFECVDELISNGKDIVRFNSELINYCRDVLICTISANPQSLVNPLYDIDTMKAQSNQLGLERLTYIIKELSELDARFKLTTQPRIVFETTLIRILTMSRTVNSEFEERLKLVERRLADPNFFATPRFVKSADTNKAPTNNTPSAKIEKPTQTKLLPGKFKEVDKVVQDLSSFQNEMLASFFHNISVYVINENLLGLVCENPVHAMIFSNTHDHEVVRASFERVVGHNIDFKVFASTDELPDVIPDKEQTKSTTKKAASIEETALELAKLANVPFEIEE